MSNKMKAFLLGIIGSFFFAFTFVLNRNMNLGGGYWMYSAVLRYVFTLPILFLVLLKGKKYRAVLEDIKKKPRQWLIWSTVGFGFFYLPLTAASLYAESWFTCAMWQVTIVAGILLTPLFGQKIPKKNLACSFLILIGIAVMQIPKMMTEMQMPEMPMQETPMTKMLMSKDSVSGSGMLMAFLLILFGAFSYPLGNRKTMAFCDKELTTLQRIFGMTLCSMPFWILFGIVAFVKTGLPQGSQCVQSLATALFSGVIATAFFFKATDMVRKDYRALAVVEATQCGEVIFTLLLGVLVLKDSPPTASGWIGIGIIVIGMVLTSLIRGEAE